jgi:TRAP-type mannitol/chloroaromatic compound transport system substrate-binding protein
VFNWRIASLLAAGETAYLTRLQEYVENVRVMSDGRLNITTYAAGVLLPSPEHLDALGRGVIEMAHTYGAYWSGVIPVTNIATIAPGMFKNMLEIDVFFWELGFIDIMREAYAEHGVYFITPELSPGFTLMLREPIDSLEDLQGVKVRTVGALVDVLEEVGVPTVYIPGEEIYTGLATGVIDAATWGSISSCWDLKLYEVAPYILVPSIKNGHAMEIIVGMDAWNSLPDDLKLILEIASRKEGLDRMRMDYNDDVVRLNDMVVNYGVTIVTMSEADWATLDEAASVVLDRFAAEDPKYSAPAVQMIRDFQRLLGYID